MKGRTCLVIAHHLETIRRADIIFVVKDSAIVERGTHDVAAGRRRRLPRLVRFADPLPSADQRSPGVVAARGDALYRRVFNAVAP